MNGAIRVEASAIMPDSPIENILSRATQDIHKLLEEAFEAGRMDGKREIAALLSNVLPSQGAVSISPPNLPLLHASIANNEGRAPSGTVKPAIKELIEKAPNGIRASDIIERTGFKDNSVRGTLAALRAEGFAERHGELWVLSKDKGPPALASRPR
jgi:hypothetical protein